MLATHTPRAHAVHPERGVHAVRFVALQGSSSETPGPMNPALQGTPGVPHPIGPSSSPLRPFGLVWGCSLAFALTSWRSQAPPCSRRRNLSANPMLLLRYADPTHCALASAVCFRRALRHAHIGVPCTRLAAKQVRAVPLVAL